MHEENTTSSGTDEESEALVITTPESPSPRSEQPQNQQEDSFHDHLPDFPFEMIDWMDLLQKGEFNFRK